MARDLDLDFEFQDEEVRERPARPAPRREGAPRGGARPAASRRRKNDTTSIIILAVEIVVFVALLVGFFILKGKIDDGSVASSSESTQESGEASSGVNVENDQFTLTCTKVQLVMDAENNVAAMIYFTFVNKTDEPLALSTVFPASVKQNGVDCPEDTNLAETPAELANKDMQVSGGQSIECCYAFKLADQTSPLTLTVHDNYSTFSDIGSTEIPLS